MTVQANPSLTTRRLLLAACLAACWMQAPAQPVAASRPAFDKDALPALTVLDAAGAPVLLPQLPLPEGNVVVLVVDAGMPSAGHAIDALVFKESAASVPVVVAVAGSEGEFAQLKRSYEKLQQFRWHRVPAREELVRSGLRVLPQVMGVGADRRIGFRYAGLPKDKDRLGAMIQAWLGVKPEAGDAR